MDLRPIEQLLYKDRGTIEFAGGLILTALVKTAPAPGTRWNGLTLYTWLYEFAHQFVNTTPKNPQQPEGPAQEK